eukprot:208053-Chlamydomonas_euryale.AAC.2
MAPAPSTPAGPGAAARRGSSGGGSSGDGGEGEVFSRTRALTEHERKRVGRLLKQMMAGEGGGHQPPPGPGAGRR